MRHKIRMCCLYWAALLWVLALSGAGPADMETEQAGEPSGSTGNPGNMETLVVESPMYTEEGDEFVPEQELERDGKRYRLSSCIREEAVKDGRTRQVSAGISCLLEGEDSPPETAVIRVKDAETGQTVECTGVFTGATERGSFWSEDFSFPVTVSGYGAGSFFLGDTELPSVEDPSGWGKELLAYLGLPESRYQVTAVRWTGEPYERDGVLVRDAKATGRKLLRDVEAVYEGTAELPPVRGYVYRCTYEPVDAGNRTIQEAEKTEETKERQETGEPAPEETESRSRTEPAPGPLEKLIGWLVSRLEIVKIGGGFFVALALTILIIVRSCGKKDKQMKDKNS